METLEATWAERLRQLGLEQGIERGIERGRTEERRALVGRLLRTRFGDLPQDVEVALAGADGAALERLFDSAASAASLQEVFPNR